MTRERYETLREFRTAQFRVIADWTYDDDLAEDHDDETRQNIESGAWVCMLVRVRVLHDTLGELAVDYLGDCIYESPEAFMDHKECAAATRKLRADGEPGIVGSYFASMIHGTIAEARAKVRELAARDYPYIRVTRSKEP